MRKLALPLLLIGVGAVACACSDSKREIRAQHLNTAVKLPALTDDSTHLLATAAAAPTIAISAAAEPSALEEPVDEKEFDVPKSFEGIIAFARSADSADVDRALGALRKARVLEPDSVIPDIEAARLLLKHGMAPEARAFAERAVDLDPQSSYGWNTLGRVQLAERDDGGAVASFERAVEYNDENAFAWNNLGLALMRLELYEESANALERATSSASPTNYMWNNLGMAYEKLHRFDLAGAAYRQAILDGSQTAVANLDRLRDDGHLWSGDADDHPGIEPDHGIAVAE